VEVTNFGRSEDRVRLSLLGLPADWVRSPERSETIPPGERINVNFQIRPPRRRDTTSGRNRFRVEMVSRNYPDAKIATSATLNVDTFERFEMDMSPTELKLPGDLFVTVRNLGNAPVDYRVLARDDANQIQFKGETGRITIPAGGETVVPMELKAAQRQVIFGADVLPFRVEVSTPSGASQTQTGQASASPLIPGWLSALLFVVALSSCFLVTGLLIFPTGGRGPTPTATATQVIVVPGSVTPGAPIPTPTVPSAEADSDGDSVSNGQEALIGSNPNNVDSDADGLSDGQEVYTYGTNPLRADTDSDGLSDLQEIQANSCLNPLLWSSAGDGVSDGQKVSEGLNPCVPLFTPVPTLTPTVTPTRPPTRPRPPTFTPMPLTPTATPTVTPTPSVTPTPTFTPPAPIATETPTFTPPAPTGTPTATFTPPAPTPTFTVPVPTDTPPVPPTDTPPAPATDTPPAPPTDTPPVPTNTPGGSTPTFTPPAPSP
jgi:hypothetical protein